MPNKGTQNKKQEDKEMRTYHIYNAEVDEIEYIGCLQACSIIDAELKAYKVFDCKCEVYALTTAPGEPWE